MADLKIVQAISLVTWGDAFLSGKISDINELNNFFNNSGPFNVCDRIEFDDCSVDQDISTFFAANPTEWLIKMKNDGYQRLYFFCNEMNWELAGFPNEGAKIIIKAEKDGHYDFWRVAWGEDEDEEDSCFVIYYRTDLLWKMSPPYEDSLENCVKFFPPLIEEINAFAKKHNGKHNLSVFIDCFESALQTLKSDDPSGIIFEEQMFPWQFFSLDAKRVMSAIEKSWVFGAIGSWNDMAYTNESDQKEYEKISRFFYSKLIEYTQIVVNQGSATPNKDAVPS